MGSLFYDNLEPTPPEDCPSMVEVERIYRLDFEHFSEEHWSQLDAVYRSLPGRYRVNQTPMWFGSDEDDPPFFWASVEPPGLQVYGVLPLDDWRRWDKAFVVA